MKLPLCEITDFSQLCVCAGDPKNVWNHVPIKAVGRDSRLELTIVSSSTFIIIFLFIMTNINLNN